MFGGSISFSLLSDLWSMYSLIHHSFVHCLSFIQHTFAHSLIHYSFIHCLLFIQQTFVHSLIHLSFINSLFIIHSGYTCSFINSSFIHHSFTLSFLRAQHYQTASWALGTAGHMFFHIKPKCQAGISRGRILGTLMEEEREQSPLAVPGPARCSFQMCSAGAGEGQENTGRDAGCPESQEQNGG